MGEPSAKTAAAPPTARPPTLIDSAALAAAKYPRHWLVEGLFLAARPAVIGGPMKALKTGLAVDLAVSLGTGTPFLGHFPVPKQRRVAVFCGESDPAELQDRARRVAAGRGADLDGCLAWWSTDLPRLGSAEGRKQLTALLKAHQIAVAVIDPLYLALMAGGPAVAAENLYLMGGRLKDAGDACRGAGATPVFVHHAVKGAASKPKTGGLRLHDLAFAGVAEYARQWLLVNPAEGSDPAAGSHRLRVSAGGSGGQGGEWDVAVDEGPAGERVWDVRVGPADADGPRGEPAGRRGPSPRAAARRAKLV